MNYRIENHLKTPYGLEYWKEDGKYTYDGYDHFDTVKEMEYHAGHKTRQGIPYWEDKDENGNYGFTIDGYDFFKNVEALERDIDWQIYQSKTGKAYKKDGVWYLV